MKRIFNETKTEELQNPDMMYGYLKDDKLLIAHHEAQEEVKEQKHEELLHEYPNGGKEYIEVIDVPYQPAKEAWDEYEDILVYVPYGQEQINRNLSARYIPSASSSAAALEKVLLKTMTITEDETKLSISGLYEEWAAGKYEVGDIRNYAGQTYECHQAHDNSIYPDITPDNAQTWATFWKPLHGKSAATARLWVKPWAGTTDMYHSGEYMIYTDGKTYKCISDTVYSPEEYSSHWEIQK